MRGRRASGIGGSACSWCCRVAFVVSAHPESWAHPVRGIDDQVAADTCATLTVLLIAAVGAVLVITWLVDRQDPRGRVPLGRTVALIAAIGTIALALTSPLTRLADESNAISHGPASAADHGRGATHRAWCSRHVARARRTRPRPTPSVAADVALAIPELPSRIPLSRWLVFVGVTWAIHVGPLLAAAG
jgi:hypothetical protein